MIFKVFGMSTSYIRTLPERRRIVCRGGPVDAVTRTAFHGIASPRRKEAASAARGAVPERGLLEAVPEVLGEPDAGPFGLSERPTIDGKSDAFFQAGTLYLSR